MQLNKKIPLEQIHQSQIRRVIGKATEKKQSKRFQSASEFRVAVEQLEKIEFKNDNIIKLPISFDLKKNKKILLIASIVLLVIVGTVGIFMHNQSPLQPAEDQSLIAARIDSLQNSVIDSYQAISVMDSLSGVKVKSSALLTEEATKDLLDPAKAENGIKTLDRVISKGYRTSSIAAYLLGRLYYEDADASDSIQSMLIQPGKATLVKRGDVVICGDTDISEQINEYLPARNIWLKRGAIASGIAVVIIGLIYFLVGMRLTSEPKDYRPAVVYVDAQYTPVIIFEDCPIHSDIWCGVLKEYGYNDPHSGEFPLQPQNYSATAFFIDREGRMATNRHDGATRRLFL